MGAREVLMSRVLLISGSTGIAGATADLARSRGIQVFTVALEALADETGDLREERFAKQVVQRCVAAHGRIDALFNVAGISGRRYGDGPLHECSFEGWESVIASNLRTTFLLSKHVLRHWLDNKQGGAILNMASVLADSPEPGHFATHAYAASKGGILALTKSMAAYYARHGIRVNAIAPGLVTTPMSLRAQSDEFVLQFMAHKQPLSEGMLHPDEIAQAALFLLSEESRHITGQVLAVDGGWSVSS